MVIDVQFKSVGPGMCAWCRKERKEVFDVTLKDGSFKLCLNDLKCHIRLKLTCTDGSPANLPDEAA